jgi:2,4-dienoyl-CoA reductase-like NADH-dependent reductase (Old Yellow Enzyme family)
MGSSPASRARRTTVGRSEQPGADLHRRANPPGVSQDLARDVHRQPRPPRRDLSPDRAAEEHWLGLGADVISFGRAFLGNPDLVERFRADLPLEQGDKATFYVGGDDQLSGGQRSLHIEAGERL